jgi:hypothetical protein
MADRDAGRNGLELAHSRGWAKREERQR